jgi:hypothetical protein
MDGNRSCKIQHENRAQEQSGHHERPGINRRFRCQRTMRSPWRMSGLRPIPRPKQASIPHRVSHSPQCTSCERCLLHKHRCERHKHNSEEPPVGWRYILLRRQLCRYSDAWRNRSTKTIKTTSGTQTELYKTCAELVSPSTATATIDNDSTFAATTQSAVIDTEAAYEYTGRW